MTVNRYVTYGDYADGYCEDWSPSGNVLLTAAGSSFAPARQPGYPTYVLSWDQASRKSTGGETFACAPYVQELLINLPWAGMAGADKAALVAFFGSADVNGQAGTFTLFSPMIGPSLPVRFASDKLPPMPEIAWDRYRVDLSLRVATNYPQLVSSGAPPAITGNRFVLGSVAIPFPAPLRAGNGYGIDRQQTMERLSDGVPVIYSKSRLILQPHRYAMALDFDGFISLQSFFFTWAHGGQNKFSWINEAGASRTVRLAGNQITVLQTAYNRYETELNLLEEL